MPLEHRPENTLELTTVPDAAAAAAADAAAGVCGGAPLVGWAAAAAS